jgi:ATP-dependent Zn protease
LGGAGVAETLFAGPRPFGEATAQLVNSGVRRISREAHQRTALLREHRPDLDALALAVPRHEALDAAGVLRIAAPKSVDRPSAATPLPRLSHATRPRRSRRP